ncbi:restriction endonuclease subunit S [Acinetobacter sp. 251-1]|uniref:restriction endonuclease subunit S n=1 Tax=Acinetobacter sp. 251-1 TaxID=2746720 RepID=UPI0025761937|nr:restriction endonuclease subunit S [Acinetobacter sp. 251-1]MDM1762106.1 restriction endonuclease subunit S [Acinetobacter sp. 251-1]
MSLDNLPVEWLLVTLEHICKKIQDGNYGGDYPKAEEWMESGIPFITGAALTNSGIAKEKLKYISVEKNSLLKKAQTTEGDVIFPNRGATEAQKFGGAKIAYTLGKDYEVSNINPQITLLRAEEGILPKYIEYLVSSPLFLEAYRESAKGSALGFMNLSKTKAINVPLTTTLEQQEIVRQLDVMLAQVEQIKARLDVIPAILKKFRQSVLADAVSGRLVEKNHSIWVEKNLSELTLKITDGEHLTPPIVESGVPLLSAKDVHEQYIDFSNCKYIERSIADKALSRCNPQYHDLLVVSRGATVGRTHYLKNSREFCLMGSVLLIRANMALIQPAYLDIFFKSELGRKQLISSSGASAQQAIYIRDVKKMKVSYPSIEVQEDIIVQVNTLFKFIEKIEFTVQSAQKRVNLLTQSILAKAFSGELTAEWRTQHHDLITGINSAESLLAKIQAEREANKPVKKTRAKKDA